jgi:hypothetical protein
MSLAKDIKTYLSSSISHLRETEDYYKKLNLADAVEQAVLGQSPKSSSKTHMDSHQRRVGYEACKAGLKELLEINKKTPLAKCKSFEDIFNITEQVKRNTARLGDLWSYDTALRIGFNLGLYPKQVYTQAGVVKGVKKALNGKLPKGRSLPLNIFPIEIQKLQPFEAENFLCIWGKAKGKGSC